MGKYGEPWEVNGEDEHAGGLEFIEISSGECPSPEFTVHCEVPADNDDFVITDADRKKAARIVACANALSGLSDEALAQDPIGKVREALEAFAFRISQFIGDDHLPDDYEIQAKMPMHEVRAARAVLALLKE